MVSFVGVGLLDRHLSGKAAGVIVTDGFVEFAATAVGEDGCRVGPVGSIP